MNGWIDRGTELLTGGHAFTELGKQLQERVEAGAQGLGDLEAIKQTFGQHGIKYEQWPEAQWQRFCRQVEAGETQVHILSGERPEAEQNPLVVRYSSVVALRVLHPNGKSEIFEYKQASDGSEKCKIEAGEQVPGISEKVLGGEEFIQAAVRGLKEELDLEIDPRRVYVDPERRDRLLYKPDDYKRGFYTGLYVQSWVVQLRDTDNVCSEYSEDKGSYKNVFRWQAAAVKPWVFPDQVFQQLTSQLGNKPIVGILRARILDLAGKVGVTQWKGDVSGLAKCLAQATARRSAPPLAFSDNAIFVGTQPGFVLGIDGNAITIRQISVRERGVKLDTCAVSEQTLRALGKALSVKEERIERVYWQPWVPVGMAGAASVLNIIFQLLFNH